MATATLWTSHGGEIACVKHGGSYLRAAAATKPRARQHATSADVWTKIDAADVKAWAEFPDLPPLACETCGATSDAASA